jgi:PAS domain S-box-containing protein
MPEKRKPVYLLDNDKKVGMFLDKFENSFNILMTIIESSYDGIYITDGDANTIFVNSSYCLISGLSKEEVLGKNMHELERFGVISRSGTILAIEKGEIVTIDQQFKSGKHVLITSTPVFDDTGSIVMVVTNVRDQSELHHLRVKLEESSSIAQKYHSEIELMRKQFQQESDIITIDREMLDVLNVLNRVAQSDTPVLFLGETGVGKERAATYLHSKSTRYKQNFIKVNCGMIPKKLLESELFGYSTGVTSEEEKHGYFGIADKGTIFLDGICDLSLSVQGQLLQVLQNHEITRVGSNKSIPIDVRILAATNSNLEEMVKTGKFREDL